jgi:hypothetical protein
MTAPATPAGPVPTRRWKRYLVLVLILLLLLPALYTWAALHWDYSNGYRSGLLNKFSQKGWFCKTHEGELWQSVVANVAPTVWEFSVRDPRVVAQLDTLVGKTVRLHYTEHRGVPTKCFAETRYFVDSVALMQ